MEEDGFHSDIDVPDVKDNHEPDVKDNHVPDGDVKDDTDSTLKRDREDQSGIYQEGDQEGDQDAQQDKKQKVEEPEDPEESTNSFCYEDEERVMNTNTNEEDDVVEKFSCKTMNVSVLSSIIGGLCSLPNVKFIDISISENGIQFYASAPQSPCTMYCFLNHSQFVADSFKCPEAVHFSIAAHKLDYLRAKLGKDINVISFENIESADFPGICVHGKKASKSGGDSDFTINLYDDNRNRSSSVNMPESKHGWHVTTDSTMFMENLNFTFDKTDAVGLKIGPKEIQFSTLSESGLPDGSVSHEHGTVDEDYSDLAFECLFNRKHLKCVVKAHSLSKSLNISFNVDDCDTTPVLFSYKLDNEGAMRSHFTLCIYPLISE